LNLPLDPNGLLDDRKATTIVEAKLTVRDGEAQLSLPTLLEALVSSIDLSTSPPASKFDVLHYLSKGRRPNEARNFNEIEGYQMQRDCYVLGLGTVSFHHSRPRTNPKDPMSGLPYYLSWIIIFAHEDDERIILAYYCCR